MGNLQWKIGDVTVTRIVESVAHRYRRRVCSRRARRKGIERNAVVAAPALPRRRRQPRAVDPRARASSRGRPQDRRRHVHRQRPRDPGLRDAAGRRRPSSRTSPMRASRAKRSTSSICTHLHFDHVGWNTMLVDGEWVPTFPNARYLLCREEWEHCSTEGDAGYARDPRRRGAGRSSTPGSPISCRPTTRSPTTSGSSSRPATRPGTLRSASSRAVSRR